MCTPPHLLVMPETCIVLVLTSQMHPGASTLLRPASDLCKDESGKYKRAVLPDCLGSITGELLPHRMRVRIIVLTEESPVVLWDLGPGSTFQKRSVSSPTAQDVVTLPPHTRA